MYLSTCLKVCEYAVNRLELLRRDIEVHKEIVCLDCIGQQLVCIMGVFSAANSNMMQFFESIEELCQCEFSQRQKGDHSYTLLSSTTKIDQLRAAWASHWDDYLIKVEIVSKNFGPLDFQSAPVKVSKQDGGSAPISVLGTAASTPQPFADPSSGGAGQAPMTLSRDPGGTIAEVAPTPPVDCRTIVIYCLEQFRHIFETISQLRDGIESREIQVCPDCVHRHLVRILLSLPEVPCNAFKFLTSSSKKHSCFKYSTSKVDSLDYPPNLARYLFFGHFDLVRSDRTQPLPIQTVSDLSLGSSSSATASSSRRDNNNNNNNNNGSNNNNNNNSNSNNSSNNSCSGTTAELVTRATTVAEVEAQEETSPGQDVKGQEVMLPAPVDAHEEQLEKLEWDEWPGVNGLRDHADNWRDWTQTVSLRSHGETVLQILPYCVLDEAAAMSD